MSLRHLFNVNLCINYINKVISYLGIPHNKKHHRGSMRTTRRPKPIILSSGLRLFFTTVSIIYSYSQCPFFRLSTPHLQRTPEPHYVVIVFMAKWKSYGFRNEWLVVSFEVEYCVRPSFQVSGCILVSE